MYIFFHRPFSITVLSPQFDLEFLFDGIPLDMAHLVFDPPPPSPILDTETDPLKASPPPIDT